MKKLFLLFCAVFSTTTFAQNIIGAGATFPAPVYSKWAEMYAKDTKAQVNYSAIGSSGGIKQIDSKTVDFGATDDPMKESDVKVKGYYQFPTVIGGVVPVVNLKGVEPGQLVLDGTTLADIYVGKITKWNDAKIAKLNPTVKLPDQTITIVVRADGSGTTAVFTDYLSKVSVDFKSITGTGKTVSWKAPNVTAGKGNAGVAAFVKQINGSIGYVEYAYVKQNKMTYAAMKNRQGKTVHPDDTTFAEAARSANWSVPGMAVNLNNQNGWPITAATFILIPEKSAKSRDVVKFFNYAFEKGDQAALDLDYVPLPAAVKSKIQSDWQKLGLH